jgi:hypothetical protein
MPGVLPEKTWMSEEMVYPESGRILI